MTAGLWCIHIPGPDDVYAASSKDAAERMAATHNATMLGLIARNPLTENDPPVAAMMAVVTPWPWSEKSHADDLAKNGLQPRPLPPGPDGGGA